MKNIATPSAPVTPLGQVLDVEAVAALTAAQVHQLAVDPATPVETLLELHSASQVDVSRLVDRHPNVPAEVLDFWAKNENIKTRMNLLENPNVSSDTLWEMIHFSRARSGAPKGVAWVELPVEVREEIKVRRDIEVKVRIKIIKHQNINPGILSALTRDHDSMVRLLATKHPMTPRRALLGVIEHCQPMVDAARDGGHMWKFNGVSPAVLIDAAQENLRTKGRRGR